MFSSENISYFVKFNKSHVHDMFNGNQEACNRYIEENLPRVVAMMDKYTESGNPWWLEENENMAYHQLKEIDSMLVEYSKFTDHLSRLVNRPITSLKIKKNYPFLLAEANEAYTDFIREQVLNRYIKKEHEQQPQVQIF